MADRQRFRISLNDSGLGDQIMSARVACWLGKEAGLLFDGITSMETDFESRSSISGQTSGTELLRAIGLDQMIKGGFAPTTVYRIPLVDSIQEEVNKIILLAKAIPDGYSLALHIDGAEADYFYKNFVGKLMLKIFDTDFDRSWRQRLATESESETDTEKSRDRNVLIHLRLGDIANLRVPGARVVIPNHYVQFGDEAGLRRSLDRNFDRYDKTAEILSCIRFLRRHGYTIYFHSDGFQYTRHLIKKHADKFVRIASISHFEKEINDRETELLDQLIGVNHNIGESSTDVEKFVADIKRCAFVISTTGHFAFTLATGLVRKDTHVLVEKFSRTAVSHPKVKQKFWSADYSRDLGQFIQEMRRQVSH